ncbi:hypothetical protein Kpol_505p15 [Vanderwaltozyma polyspora DSM 70294]|uniref:C2H2-type domain-containing protein n=1 Tax=Vanderwaltozyma polyspora (strain ATCC 22028 / DSM 70294 / BCRC 21397 / CBS 2163 / NBRC 10782 / NRRL Y-8283 / UCD 57-17) TaxID=436907 RepID=A7TNA6_VANPO|nr:uncharacterized protein Kpol_505p15 [Vanderwaltozyma polyspora DSM 70294]EDO16238.1 hypothetical protein Kpol_505p15 [Vanderwaltozyma polyspora DSM 70294]
MNKKSRKMSEIKRNNFINVPLQLSSYNNYIQQSTEQDQEDDFSEISINKIYFIKNEETSSIELGERSPGVNELDELNSFFPMFNFFENMDKRDSSGSPILNIQQDNAIKGGQDYKGSDSLYSDDSSNKVNISSSWENNEVLYPLTSTFSGQKVWPNIDTRREFSSNNDAQRKNVKCLETSIKKESPTNSSENEPLLALNNNNMAKNDVNFIVNLDKVLKNDKLLDWNFDFEKEINRQYPIVISSSQEGDISPTHPNLEYSNKQPSNPSVVNKLLMNIQKRTDDTQGSNGVNLISLDYLKRNDSNVSQIYKNNMGTQAGESDSSFSLSTSEESRQSLIGGFGKFSSLDSSLTNSENSGFDLLVPKQELMEEVVDKRQHKCAYCDKRFSQTGNLNTHQRLHTGERPYECHICNKRFSRKGNLTAHVITHKKLKPYICKVDGCNKKFTQLGNMKVHQNKFHYETILRLSDSFNKEESKEYLSKEDSETLKYFRTIYSHPSRGKKKDGTLDIEK